jgi:hypothetical protein
LRDADRGNALVLENFCVVNPGFGLFGDMHCATTDDSTAARASAEFCQGHLYRHHIASRVHVALVGLSPAIL